MGASEVLSSIAPQFDAEAERANLLTLATLQVSDCVFGDKTDLAIAYMAAHMLILQTDPARQTGEAGQITQKKEGDIQLSFGNFGQITDSLSLTHFGRSFVQLRDSTILAVGVTSGIFANGC